MKTVISLILIILSFVSFSQNDSVYAVKRNDEMKGTSFFITNRSFVISNDSHTKGFRIDGYISKDNDRPKLSLITATLVGLGNCNENDEIIILFDNGDRLIKKSFNSFNCNGDSYFNLNDYDIELLKKSPLSKIRITNGRTFDNYTGDVKTKDKNYFIQLINSLINY